VPLLLPGRKGARLLGAVLGQQEVLEHDFLAALAFKLVGAVDELGHLPEEDDGDEDHEQEGDDEFTGAVLATVTYNARNTTEEHE